MSSNGHVHVCSVTRADNNETFEIGYANGNGTFVSKQFARSHTLRYEPKLPTAPRNETSSSLSDETDTFNETRVADNATWRRVVVVEVTESHYTDAGTYACRSRRLNVAFLAEVVVLGELDRRGELIKS